MRQLLDGRQAGSATTTVTARDYLDCLRQPSVTRVGPMTQMLLRKKGANRQWPWPLALHHIFYRGLGLMGYIGVPLLFLLVSIHRSLEAPSKGLFAWVLWSFLLGASVALAQVALLEICYTARTLRALVWPGDMVVKGNRNHNGETIENR